jgi:DNA polymerase IV
VQPDLLETRDERCAREKWERLSDLTDALQVRYKKPILTLGPYYEPPGGYAGAKIAFGRIPSLADF